MLPEAVEVVLPKLSVALEVPTLMPIPAGLLMVVVGEVRLPATLFKVMPVVALLTDAMLQERGCNGVPLARSGPGQAR